MRIYQNVKLWGDRGELTVNALIDTGADVSLIPSGVARHIGAWCTNELTSVTGVHGDARTLPVVVAYLSFPLVKNMHHQFAFVMSDAAENVIVGMDILKPLGISIDTRTHQLSVKNEIWEAFKVLSAVGILFYGGIKVLEALSKKSG